MQYEDDERNELKIGSAGEWVAKVWAVRLSPADFNLRQGKCTGVNSLQAIMDPERHDSRDIKERRKPRGVIICESTVEGNLESTHSQDHAHAKTLRSWPSRHKSSHHKSHHVHRRFFFTVMM